MRATSPPNDPGVPYDYGLVVVVVLDVDDDDVVVGLGRVVVGRRGR